MQQRTSRRFFLGALTATAATRVWGANDRINVAIVGLGHRGSTHLNIYSRLSDARVAALCDIDRAAREVAQAKLLRITSQKAKEFEDLRDAFADPGIDAVSIATPNHWHALATIWACKAGKDVYCEKPACYDIYEGPKMLQVARETKRMVQVGSQHRSMQYGIRAMQALHSGIIGQVYMARGLCFKRRPSIGHKADSPVPPGVNWDLFRGPAPMRPFNELRFKYNWHWFWDTGNGDIGNQGVHQMGICRWGLGDPEWPKSVVATGSKYGPVDDQETPNTQLASYDFGGCEIVFEVRGLLTGGEGVPVRRRSKPDADTPAVRASDPLNITVGNLFYGTEGWMAMNIEGFQIYKGESSEIVMEERPKVSQEIEGTNLHIENFLAACRSRDPRELHDGIANAYLSASLCHLANISYRVGRKLTIDPGPQFAGDPGANELITRDYRQPFVV
ncbi:MAG: Gfo/Idh/MocA family oxidoreductase [Bryobacteraceae bacterium]